MLKHRLTAAFAALGFPSAAQVALASGGSPGEPQASSVAASAALPAEHEADATLSNYRFRDGEILPQVRLHYVTLGQPHKNAAGAAGAVGSMVTQLAREAGGYVIGTGRALPTVRRRSTSARRSSSTSADQPWQGSDEHRAMPLMHKPISGIRLASSSLSFWCLGAGGPPVKRMPAPRITAARTRTSNRFGLGAMSGSPCSAHSSGFQMRTKLQNASNRQHHSATAGRTRCVTAASGT
jgi:hypothetical protein